MRKLSCSETLNPKPWAAVYVQCMRLRSQIGPGTPRDTCCPGCTCAACQRSTLVFGVTGSNSPGPRLEVIVGNTGLEGFKPRRLYQMARPSGSEKRWIQPSKSAALHVESPCTLPQETEKEGKEREGQVTRRPRGRRRHGRGSSVVVVVGRFIAFTEEFLSNMVIYHSRDTSLRAFCAYSCWRFPIV